MNITFFVTDTDAVRIDAILSVDVNADETDPLPCEVDLVGNQKWYLSREDGERLLQLLRMV